MHIVIGCGAMPFGPNTPNVRSLGGSETAALELAKALAAKGNNVHLFCNLPPLGAPDAWPDGKALAGVTYHLVAGFGKYVNEVEHDLTIGVRDPQFMALEAKSKKKVLYAHDIFTKRGMGRALDQMGWCMDEIWTVSEWHRQQIHEATGFPLENIVALRNGIVRYDDMIPVEDEAFKLRGNKHLIYAARPERGLDNLIMPGGVMDNLPDFTLTVCMYEHYPEHMREYYEKIMARMRAMPNVEFAGGKPNHELRSMISMATAYIYPTQFEETSCILAREAIEQRTPIMTTKAGALPETLGDCGLYFEDWLVANGLTEPEKGTPGWCKLFASFFREAVNNTALVASVTDKMSKRTDLYWDGVADIVMEHAEPKQETQTLAAAIIAMNNEDTILKCLNSLIGSVDAIQIALGPCTDGTADVIHKFADDHPDIPVSMIDVPKIEPRKFGFDDARNASLKGLEQYDWILWIDTDEYLVGNLRKYLRNNYLQSYLISQHHFTVEPRGKAPQIDRPARLFRNNIGFKFKGHIHEHAEIDEGGPGRAYLCHDVDIGHTGYKDEATRKERFDRNWPFLQWEHEEPVQRKLNRFLWFRDIVHRMRWDFVHGKQQSAHNLALEGEAYYNEHYLDMAAFGPGLFMALEYMAEIYNVLGKGVPMQMSFQLDDRQQQIRGTFIDYKQLERIVAQLLEPEFVERASKYY